MNKYCLLSNDVESSSIWFNCLRDETAINVYKEGMPRLLDLYNKYSIKTTFFFTGYIAKLIPDVVKMIIPYGHEIGSHGLSHKKEAGFDVLSYNKQVEHLSESKKILEDICGEEIISFRAPSLRTNKFTVRALAESGYKIDSSVASQRFDMFMSFGGMNKLKWLTAPRLPYRTNPDNIFRKGNGIIIEVPLSASVFPYVGTTMRAFPVLTKLQRYLLAFETSINKKPIVFIIHPHEMIDETSEPRIINRRADNIFSSFLQDYLRAHLKAKNLGLKALYLYEKELNYFYKNKFEFCTIKDYCLREKLLK